MFKIVSDGSCDLPDGLQKKYDITVVPFYVTFDGAKYYKEGVDISVKEFYNVLTSQVVYPKTSLPSVSDYMDAFRPALVAGEDVLCFCITSKFSGSIQSAINAKNIALEEFPGRTIEVIDSTLCTFAEGTLVLEACRLRENGSSLSETVEVINVVKHLHKAYFTVDSLEYLQRGGRIGRVSSFAGSILNIKPIIVLEKGELHPISKVRGRKKAMSEILNIIDREIGGAYNKYNFNVIHSEEPGDADYFIDYLQNTKKAAVLHSPIEIGITVGTHIGPTVVGIIYSPKVM